MATSPQRRSVRGADELLARPRWQRVRQVPLIRREIREFVPPSTIELLLQGADQVVEGAPEMVRPRGGGKAVRIYATCMMTIDLQRLSALFREPADTSTAARLAEHLDGHPDLRRKLEDRLRPHLARLGAVAEAALTIDLDFTVRAQGRSLLIDADASATAGEG